MAREMAAASSLLAVRSSGEGSREVKRADAPTNTSSRLNQVARRSRRSCIKLWFTTMVVIQVLKRASSRKVCSSRKARQ